MAKTKKPKIGNTWPDSLKNPPKEKAALRPDGKEYRWGTIMPLIGGFPLGAAKATGVKPQFIASWPAFRGNDQHIMEYWDDVPLVAINDDMEAEPYELKEGEEDNNVLSRYAQDFDEDLFKDMDFVVSVPLCSGLSMLNASNGSSESSRGSDAIQNKWIYETARFALEKIKPKAFVGENAPGLFTKMGEGVVENLKAMAEEFGYKLVLYKTNTVKHGIPQSRHRTFYFFFKDTLPRLELINKEFKTLDEFLKEIPEWAEYQELFTGTDDITTDPLTNFVAENMKDYEGDSWHSNLRGTVTGVILNHFSIDEACEWIEERYTSEETEDEKGNYIKYNKKAGDRAIRFLRHVENKIKMGKGWWDATHLFLNDRTNAIIGKTIGSFVHPSGTRTLNHRELFWLMGMPHDFTVVDNNFYHVTQNVPVTTAADIITQIMKAINGELPGESGNFLRINNDRGSKSAGVNAKPVKSDTSKQLF